MQMNGGLNEYRIHLLGMGFLRLQMRDLKSDTFGCLFPSSPFPSYFIFCSVGSQGMWREREEKEG